MKSGPVATPLAISIIIPTFNEAGHIGRLLRHLQHICHSDAAVEIVVADGGSTDRTTQEAAEAGARVVTSPRKGRAAQLNFGASQASGNLLYFLHADTFPPATLLTDLRAAVAAGYSSGCYRLTFDEPHWFLQANAWFTRFSPEPFRFGDQSLFVLPEIFRKAGGYREDMIVFEDQEITRRLRQHGKFRVLPEQIVTSARKYRDNGPIRLQSVYYLITLLYRLGVPQPKLAEVYRSLIRQDKV
ncbi:transferase 2, rSAM/selenodomain-associated [Hymenobacter gelipurpurascens]|uniref:Transferase 2, rSAM/selenodomain-associated n=1 Tax=Hymenobacter gelipurpurascens TaxID=89968 RepID=A0A212TDG6_9BACT|nr:TIGR04283 family arsenosugar biosynthesis glycosyltransferase [Hymenobacter gelipurpurascens]SNC63876.1 transferase 2, rSAM/selenodomain-associated [Hymenobacter gelipurpurascens]